MFKFQVKFLNYVKTNQPLTLLVKRAKGLKIKGKNGTNDPFVTIGLGKEKFQTSVVEKAAESVEWMEQCEL